MTEFVKKLRKKGWTAKNLAERWGISPRQISNIGTQPSQKDWDALSGLPDRSDKTNPLTPHRSTF